MLSKKILELPESATLKASEKARELMAKGIKVLRFDIGEPGFNTPKHIIEAAYEALKKGMTHYTSSRGIPELKRAISEKYRNEYKVDIDPNKNIIITPGSKYAIYATLESIINPGDEVLILAPCWVSYEGIVKLVGGKPRFIASTRDYRPDIEAINEAISKRTKAIIINSPNNPTGVVFTEKELKSIAEVAIENNLILISDEIYEEILFEGKHTCILELLDLDAGCVVINGFSKAYAMTGWRLGYILGSKKLIGAINKIMQQTVSCVPPFIQWAGYVALTSLDSKDFIKSMVLELKRRRDLLYAGLKSINGIRVVKPNGAFYFFPEIEEPNISSEDIVNYLLEEYAVVAVPGKHFGGYDHCIRFSFGATGVSEIKELIARLRKALEELRIRCGM